MTIIYKICDEALWSKSIETNVFDGAPIDLEDGYIHFSTASQVRETAAKHFKRLNDLILFAVQANDLGDALKWEPSRGGDLFPHLYSTLKISDVLWSKPLLLNQDGNHIFPELD